MRPPRTRAWRLAEVGLCLWGAALAGAGCAHGSGSAEPLDPGATAAPDAPAPLPASARAHWEFYFAETERGPASVMFTLDQRADAPLAALPTRLEVFLLMETPGEHGMGEAEEGARIDAIELELARTLERRLDAVAVGRIRSAGVVTFVYYAPDAEGLDAAVAEALARTPAAQAEARAEADPAWRFYREELLPNAERLRWILDRHAVEALAREGDALGSPRPVTHWAYFPTKVGRAAFTRAAALHGFVVVDDALEVEGVTPYGAEVRRGDIVELEAIHAIVMQLTQLAEVEGGRYDGWETSVVRR